MKALGHTVGLSQSRVIAAKDKMRILCFSTVWISDGQNQIATESHLVIYLQRIEFDLKANDSIWFTTRIFRDSIANRKSHSASHASTWAVNDFMNMHAQYVEFGQLSFGTGVHMNTLVGL